MQLLDALVKFVDSDYTHFNKRCLAITSDTETKVQTMHFKDGTTAQADVVLVANGVKSTLRGMMMSEPEPETPMDAIRGVAFSGLMNFRGLVRQENALAMGVDTSAWGGLTSCLARDKVCNIERDPFFPALTQYCGIQACCHVPSEDGQNRMSTIHTFMILRGSSHLSQMNIAAYVRLPSSVQLPPSHPTTEPATTEELLSYFPESDFAPEIRNLLKCIEKPTKWYMNIVHPHLDTYSKGRVALLGDAVRLTDIIF